MELFKADDDVHVQFFWAIVSVEWEEEESRALLEQIIEHHVTIRLLQAG